MAARWYPRVLLSACAILACAKGPKVLAPDTRLELASSAVDAIRVPGARFVSTQAARTATSGALAGPIFGPTVTQSVAEQEGLRMTEQYGLVDPALAVADGLATVLRTDLGIPNARAFDDPSGRPERAPFTLHVQTLHWQMVYFLTNWNRYRVVYSATAWIERASNSQVVWRGGCWIDDGDPDTSPTLDEIEANEGERLRAILSATAQSCVAELRAALVAAEPR